MQFQLKVQNDDLQKQMEQNKTEIDAKETEVGQLKAQNGVLQGKLTDWKPQNAQNNSWQKLAMSMLFLALLSGSFLAYKIWEWHNKTIEWNSIRKDVYSLELAENKTLQSELKHFVGVWTSYTGSPLIRHESNFEKKVAQICWEFTDSGKGYLKIRRWRTGLCDYGFAIMESTNIISFHIWNQETNSLPRHSIIKLPTNGESKRLNCLSVGWSLGKTTNEEIAIREVLERFCNNCTVVDAKAGGMDESRHFDLTLSSGDKIASKYLSIDSIKKEIRQLIDSTSMIRQYPNGG